MTRDADCFADRLGPRGGFWEFANKFVELALDTMAST